MVSPHIKRIQLPKFLEHTARGEQNDAENLLKANLDAQFLLASESFTDYSGRTFHCTAFEYAYWAKDIHMCRMLKSYMDEATKTEMLRRCEDIEENGLTYLQNSEVKKTSHFDLAPLMIALQDYINGYDDWEANENILALQAAWLKVGLQQREIPALW
ncbi:hypothetical protein Lsan_1500 [Legionella santicrucis]|uniref:Uncharacterized protein n=1 Tax=Legionella santicrucis TaxID=45074 RepID=A0A0W0Z1Z8_9GAMM|nr:hypothetical protein [Legionella santicrucis]KTD63146.1 hypothetical protein Lsan_1500 [Legionella santicrucis]